MVSVNTNIASISARNNLAGSNGMQEKHLKDFQAASALTAQAMMLLVYKLPIL